MSVLKKVGSFLLGAVALIAINATAQTQNVPVSCNWVQTGSQSGPYTAIITFQCQESGGNVAATRTLTYSAPSWQVTNCSISLASGVYNSGTCQSASLYRVEPIVIPPACPNAGKYLGQGCANGTVNIPVSTLCGNNCSLRLETIGWTPACPYEGHGRSPEVKVYCK